MRSLHRDPDATELMGRQPELAKWTPSNPFAWYGSIVDGERFTREQHATLISKGMDPVTVPAMTVRRQASRDRQEVWWPTSDLPPRYAFECPVVGRSRDGRIRVIAPNGDTKLVQPDGWAHRPYRLPEAYKPGVHL